mmetsp:Transcript_62279/g.157377  ORF Transcript_62279/g.157377 Transcript_62279/m.157377 type:complete len:274 (+) Transcript_62279:300-1121(+)
MGLVDLQSDMNRVGILLHHTLESAEVCPAKSTGFLEKVRRVSAIGPAEEGVLQCGACWCVEEERAEAVGGAAVAAGVEEELHVFDAGGRERDAAQRVAGGEAAPQQRRALQPPLDAAHHARAHELHGFVDLVGEPVVDVSPEDHPSLQRLVPQIFLRLLNAFRGRRSRLYGVLHLTNGFEYLHTDAQGILLSVDLVFQEAQALSAIGHAAIEDLFALSALVADVEPVDQVHALARPQEGGAIACGLLLDRWICGFEELELELEAVGAGHVELR